MDLQASTLWWLAAGVLVAIELGTGTFYLLMLALGLAAAALAAHAGAGPSSQWLTAALVGGGAVALWHRQRQAQPRPDPQRNPDLNLDIGERVQVAAWSEQRTARVQHRGAQWDARLSPGMVAAPGWHRIAAIDGSQLVLVPESA